LKHKSQFIFKATLWQFPAPVSGWHFVSLPKDLSIIIRKENYWQEEGWGRLKVCAQIGKSNWPTAIWFDTKQDTYLMPVKEAIRKQEQLTIHQELEVMLTLSTDRDCFFE